MCLQTCIVLCLQSLSISLQARLWFDIPLTCAHILKAAWLQFHRSGTLARARHWCALHLPNLAARHLQCSRMRSNVQQVRVLVRVLVLVGVNFALKLLDSWSGSAFSPNQHILACGKNKLASNFPATLHSTCRLANKFQVRRCTTGPKDCSTIWHLNQSESSKGHQWTGNYNVVWLDYQTNGNFCSII